MRKKNGFRPAAVLLSLLLTAQLMIPVYTVEQTDTILIRTAEDLVSLARNCRLDSWSRGKTIVLNNDISLSGIAFSTIPTFGGTFDGGGHTVSGWTLMDNHAPVGFFSRIQKSGTVKNLTVEGTISPDGEAEAVGGIVGENAGTVENCHFSGEVTGDTAVGGIAGRNTGSLIRCGAQGGVFGKKMAGGIAGENRGTISSCDNKAYVNTTASDSTFDLSDLDIGLNADIGSFTKVDPYHTVTDSGGIAGYSDGMILDCTNSGTVGYQRLGYNIGGIVGRSSGFLSGCRNSGEIYGRREVGGIVGQAEPYVISILEQSRIESIRAELQALNQLVDKAAADADASSGRITEELSAIGNRIDRASDAAKDLGDTASGYLDDSLAEVNRGSDVLEHAMRQFCDIAAQFSNISARLETGIEMLVDAMDRLEPDSPAEKDAIADLKSTSADLEEALRLLNAGTDQINRGIALIKGASNFIKDHAQIKRGLTEIFEGLRLLRHGDSDSGGRSVAALLLSASKYLKSGLANAGEWTGPLGDALQEIEDTGEYLQDTAGDITDALEDIAALADYLDNVDPLHFGAASERIDPKIDDVHDSVRGISDRLERLNQEVDQTSDLLAADIRAINRQFLAVMNLLLDTVSDSEDDLEEDRVKDTSEQDIDAVTEGKISLCANSGAVYGDYAVGGIAGAMGIYNELDPEEDGISNLYDSLRSRYELKAILQNCTNTGSVTAKRNYVGSVCGLAKLGLISGCKAYGTVESESGDYVGGLAGGSNTTVRSSYAKCSLSGARYVGGIIGSAVETPEGKNSGSRVTDCVSLAEILEAEQYAGAVAGRDTGIFRNNLYVSDQLAGIDRMSYEGRASGISYDALLQRSDLPGAFSRFQLTFRTEDQVIKTVDFHYGDSLDVSVFPDIPQKSGMFGKWDRTSLEDLRFDTVVTAEYFPFVTTLSSTNKRADGRPVFLAEGEFTDEDSMHAEPTLCDFKNPRKGVWATLRSYHREMVEQWQLTIPPDGNETVRVRYLPSEGESNHLHAYLYRESGWEELSCGSVGSYLTFSLPSGGGTVTILRESTTWWVWTVIVVFLLGMAAVAIRHRLLSRLYRRTAAKVSERGAKIAAMPAPRRLLHQFLVMQLVLLGLLCGAVALMVCFVPAVKNGVEVYQVLSGYELRDELDMELTVTGKLGDRTLSTAASVYSTVSDGKRVSCMTLGGVPIYFSNGCMILESGSVYALDDQLPDGMCLLSETSALYKALNVDAERDGDETVYRVSAGEEASGKILDLLLPGKADLIAGSGILNVELVTQDGIPGLVRYGWADAARNHNGADASLTAELRLSIPQQESHVLPAAVVSAASTADGSLAQPLPANLRTVLVALTGVLGRDPMSAQMELTANCGPLLLNDTLQLHHSILFGTGITCVKKGALSVYISSDGTRCAADGGPASAIQSAAADLAELLPILYHFLLEGDPEAYSRIASQDFTMELSDTQMEQLFTAMTPEAGGIHMAHFRGEVQFELAGDTLIAISARCIGQVKVALVDVPASFTVSVTFPEEKTTFHIPERVQTALLAQGEA